MQDLIRVTTDERGSQVVSARELYEFLEVKAQFTDWCKRMFEYGFVENQDYVLLLKNVKQTRGGQNAIDYALTLDTSKEIAMLQRSDKGKLARQYFIECEKQLKTSQLTNTPVLSPKELALLVIKAEEEKERLMVEVAALTPKANYTDVVLKSEGCHTVTSIAKELGMSGRELNRQLCEAGVQYRHRDHYVLYAKYQSKGYTETETHPYFNSKGEVMVAVQMVWTEYGRVFVHSLFNQGLSFSKTYNMAVAVSQIVGVSC